MKVSNLTSSRGNQVVNQFLIEHDGERFFQSYRVIVVKIDYDNKIYLDENFWDYSRTTRKYRNIFLNESSGEIKRKIKSKEYLLMNLNS